MNLKDYIFQRANFIDGQNYDLKWNVGHEKKTSKTVHDIKK